MAQPDLVDQMLDFGGMRMPLGHAYPPKAPGARPGPPHGVPVAKQLVTINGQTVLAEDIPWAEVTNQLVKLPQQSAKADRPKLPTVLKLELAKDQPNPKAAVSFEGRLSKISSTHPILLASAYLGSKLPMADQNGFVMDYTLVPSSGPYTFEAGETYLVNSQVYLSGVTFHQGAIIKYGSSFATLTIEGSVSTYYPPTRSSGGFHFDERRFRGRSDPTVATMIQEVVHWPAGNFNWNTWTLTHISARWIFDTLTAELTWRRVRTIA